MKEQLELLWELQKIDLDLKQIKEERDRFPKEMKKLEEKQTLEKERFQKEKEKLETLEKERRKRERDLLVEQDKIKKAEGKMSEVKTNKEYQALLTEIETIKESAGRIEEEILIMLEEIDETKKHLMKKEREMKANLEKIEAERKRIEERLAEGERIWKQKMERKDVLSKQIDSGLIKLYNTLKEKRQGIGIVSVKKETCQGCFVHVPPQMFIEVQKTNSLIRCPNCNRILYFEGDGEKR